MPIRAEAEGEDRVLGVAGVVVRGPIGPEDGEVRLPAEPVVKGAEKVGHGFFVAPGVFEPAGRHLGVGPAMIRPSPRYVARSGR